MKTIVIFSGYCVPHIGGIERYTDNLSRKMEEKKIKVIIVTSNYDNSNYHIKNGNIEIYKLPVFNIFKNRYPIIKKNSQYKYIMSLLDKYDIDAIIVNTRFHLTSHIGAKYGSIRKIPVYLIEHGSNYVTLNNKFIDFFANRYEDFLTFKIKKKVTAFYGVSSACNQWLKHFHINASGIWYNSIDTKQKLLAKQVHKDTNFLYAGRIIKQKGVSNILNAFRELEKKYQSIHLFIAGDGPELDEYKREYISKNITFLGKLNYNELVKYYAKTDIFLYPPLWPEGLPTSILEAGLMKCAVIGTNQGGIKEIIKNNDNGIIVDTDEKSLIIAMEKLINDKKLITKYGNSLNKYICNKFSWEVTTNKILEDMGVVYEEK